LGGFLGEFLGCFGLGFSHQNPIRGDKIGRLGLFWLIEDPSMQISKFIQAIKTKISPFFLCLYFMFILVSLV